MTSISLTYRNIQSKVKAINFPCINWKIALTLGVFLCFALFIFYVISVNQLTQGSHALKSYKKEIDALSKENKAVESSFSEIGFLDQLHDKVKELGFEKASNIRYVEIIDASLAKSN